MARACQHCGTALPAVVDAFCPECRADLSLAPEEVTNSPLAEYADEYALRDRIYIISLAVCGVLLFASGVSSRNWGNALLGFACAVVAGLLWHRFGRGERTTVTGKSKTPKGPHTPQ